MQDFILLKSNQCYKKINIRDVFHITVNGDCSTFYYENERISVSASLKLLKSKLPDSFIRVNRNVIINIDQISRISYKERFVELSNGYKTEIAVRRVKEVKLHLSEITLRLSRGS